MQRASVTQMEKTRLVMWTELSRFRLGKRRCYGFARKRRECHAGPRTSCLQSANNSPIDKSLFRGINQSSFTPRSRRKTLISKFSKREAILCCYRSNYRSSVRQVNSSKQLIEVAAGGAFKHIHFQLDNISMEPSGLICVIKKNSLWTNIVIPFDYNSPA